MAESSACTIFRNHEDATFCNFVFLFGYWPMHQCRPAKKSGGHGAGLDVISNDWMVSQDSLQ